MSDMKQVKVDNWGIYFLQRLKHFFNRTDYCDLTLQFQDNAQLKVHRLVLNACTEYFELLERTCEMYEDCLIMPDDLQADVVVPIVNFMYTGQLEFKNELLEKLYQTSQIMNMPVLSKLLDVQRTQPSKALMSAPSMPKQSYSRAPVKRPYTKAFETAKQPLEKRMYVSPKKIIPQQIFNLKNEKPEYRSQIISNNEGTVVVPKKSKNIRYTLSEPRPTRYEIPEELDGDNVYSDSFSSISYESKPLMVHPETSKRYQFKKSQFGIFNEASSSRKFLQKNTINDIVECRKISVQNDDLFDDTTNNDDYESPQESSIISHKKDPSQLFDQVFEADTRSKVTIEAKDEKQNAIIDHAKIISEVLKKYPHLVNSNKNIKLKILENPLKPEHKITSKKRTESNIFRDNEFIVKKEPELENTYEDVLNSKEAARLISMGAENIKGPWICLICGTPGKALHFPQYYKYRRHLVEVHNEKPIPAICEYCGHKSFKRNYMLHHLLTEHGVPPPPSYHFPKCNECSYIALTESFLAKHKATHMENKRFKCNVCFIGFRTSNLLLRHIQNTGHKYSSERKIDFQCIYCLKFFVRESSLYTHLKTSHKAAAKKDRIIDDSDEEQKPIKYEPNSVIYENEDDTESNEMQYQIQSRPDGNIHITTHTSPRTKQKILNSNWAKPIPKQMSQSRIRTLNRTMNEEFLDEENINTLSPNNTNNLNEEIMINEDYAEQDQNTTEREQYYIPTMEQIETVEDTPLSNSALEFAGGTDEDQSLIQHTKIHKETSSLNPSMEIVMTNEEVNPTQVPLIYDADGNPGKTCILTTLENAHSREVMILPDDYALNVSHSVDTTNPNIVVVYSHPVGQQNKQFIVNSQYGQPQLITSQEAHFVQSPAVITPNYEGVVTAAHNVDAQVVGTPTHNIDGQVVVTQAMPSFQNSIVSDQVTLEANQLVMPSTQEQSFITAAAVTESNNNLEELTQIQVMGQESEHVKSTCHIGTKDIADASGTSATMSIVSNEQSVVNNPALIVQSEKQCLPMTVHITPEHQTVIISHTDSQQNDNVCDQNMETVETTHDHQDTEAAPSYDHNMTQEVLEVPNIDINTENNEIVEYGETNEEGKITEETIQSDNAVKENSVMTEVETTSTKESTANMGIVNTNGHLVVPVQASEQITKLASEWSEDEEDNTKNKTNEVDIITTVEVEESIENIQQEMQKQIDEAAASENVDSEKCDKKESEECVVQNASVMETVVRPTNVNVEASKEKLSSLLNDWEENDSQDGDDAVCEKGNTSKENIAIKENTSNEAQTASEESKKVPNLKSLVSDWSDDEEENKK